MVSPAAVPMLSPHAAAAGTAGGHMVPVIAHTSYHANTAPMVQQMYRHTAEASGKGAAYLNRNVSRQLQLV